MSRTFVIRLAAAHDAPRIAAMSRDLIEHGLGWSWTTARVTRSLVDTDTNVIVARCGGETAGFGLMKYHADEAHLLLLAVQPGHARHGVGSGLLAWLEASALTAGVGQVYLEARLNNAGARAFYRARGYHEIQVVPGYYQGREASVRLAKDLWLERPALG